MENMKQIESFFASRYPLGIKPGLERMEYLLASVGNPQAEIRGVHVAGTNGKGSTIHLLCNALMENNLRVGVFSSPSLNGLTGHIQINKSSIDERIFIQLFNKLYPYIRKLDKKEMHPTEFEIITTIAFMYFSENVDIAIIEVGMGGREDTTNCFTPICSVITTVSMDHTAFLGNKIEEIAYQKAGIIKSGVPVVVGELAENSLAVVKKEADKQKSTLYQFQKDFSFEKLPSSDRLQTFRWMNGDSLVENITIQLIGLHQVKNATVSMMVLKLLKEAGLPIHVNKSLIGIERTTIPGRFEKVREQPTIIIDGAHNQAGIQAFIHTVQEKYKNNKKHLLFSGFKDKDLTEMIQMCIPIFDTITITSFEHPRSLDLRIIERRINDENVFINPHWNDVIEKTVNNKSKEQIYFVTGSLHFIGKVRRYFTR